MTDGSRAENELVDWLWANDFAPVRSPASGTKDIPQPDVVAVGRYRTYGVEVKAYSTGCVTIPEDEIEQLHAWCDKSGTLPVIAVRPDLRRFDGWLCYDIADLHETDGGRSVRLQDHDRAKSLEAMFR